jgi:hypothetical protein
MRYNSLIGPVVTLMLAIDFTVFGVIEFVPVVTDVGPHRLDEPSSSRAVRSLLVELLTV